MIDMDKIYVPSTNLVSRNIEGEMILIPITADIADMEEDIFTLNNTGKAIWDKLDGINTPANIVELLVFEYETNKDELKEDVAGFLEALLSRNIIVEA